MGNNYSKMDMLNKKTYNIIEYKRNPIYWLIDKSIHSTIKLKK